MFPVWYDKAHTSIWLQQSNSDDLDKRYLADRMSNTIHIPSNKIVSYDDKNLNSMPRKWEWIGVEESSE